MKNNLSAKQTAVGGGEVKRSCPWQLTGIVRVLKGSSLQVEGGFSGITCVGAELISMCRARKQEIPLSP